MGGARNRPIGKPTEKGNPKTQWVASFVRDTLHVHYPPFSFPASFHVLLSSRRCDAIFPPVRPQTSGGWWWEVAVGGGWKWRRGPGGYEKKKKKHKQNKKTSHAMIAHTHTKPFRHFRTSLFFLSFSLSVTQGFELVVGCVTLGAGVCGQGSSLSDHLFTLPFNSYTLSCVVIYSKTNWKKKKKNK